MSSALENVTYYKSLIRKNEQAWLKSKTAKDKKILARQIKTFQKLQARFHTLASAKIQEENQLKLL